MTKNLNELIEAGRNSAVAVSFRAAKEMIDKVATGEMPIAYVSGPGGCGKTHAALGAIESFRKRGLPPVYCNPASYRDVVSALKKSRDGVRKPSEARPIIMEEADVIFRSDKCLNLLKIATDRKGTGTYDGLSVRSPLVVTTNASLDDLASNDKVRGEHLRALFNRVPPVTISYDRRANYDYTLSLALTGDLLRFTPAKQQISRATVARSLDWFTANFNRIELLTARTLANVAEYYTSFSPETADTMLDRLLLPEREWKHQPAPLQIDWASVVEDAVEWRRMARSGDVASPPRVITIPLLAPPVATQPLPAPHHVPAPYWVDLSELESLFQWENKIGWTGRTLNCIVGCTKVSRACKNCYAAALVARGMHEMHRGLARWDRGKALWTGEVRYDAIILKERPRKWRAKPSLVFFTSLSDPFHEKLSVETIQEMLDGCAAYPQHIFQWLTKRPERAAALANRLRWPTNIWIGATIEEDKEAWRADELRKVPVATKFISAEPLTVDAIPSLDLTDIGWLIVGGESGNGAEPMHPDWARSLRDRALDANTAFFFKQWGKFGPDGLKRNPKDEMSDILLDDRIWQQFPRAALEHGRKFEGFGKKR